MLFDYEDRQVTISSGRKMGVAQFGDLKGRPLFFFHGWPSSRLHAKILHNAAKKLKIRVISLDRPGYGLSDFTVYNSLLNFADDVLEVANVLNIEKFSVIGESGGGPYAAACAYKIPEKLVKVGIVVGLAPINIKGILQGMGFFNKLVWQMYQRYPVIERLSPSFRLVHSNNILLKSSSSVSIAPSDKKILSDKVRQDMLRNSREAFIQGGKGANQDLRLYASSWNFTIKDILANVYLWYGEKDKTVTIKMGDYFATQIPNSTLTIYPNEGHFLLRNHSDEILASLSN